MKLPTPRWWYVREGRPGPVLHLLLKPLSWAWAAATAHRIARGRPVDPGVPVVCVGNITLGGTGKTPVVATLARRLDEAGRRPAILSRGYGGSLEGPVRVDPSRHAAREVGDEPLMLAAALPGVAVWVARDRVAGALAAVREGADVILLDDGHQNPALRKTLSLVVSDGETRDGEWPLGDGGVFPAGPLREPLAAGLSRADAVILLLPADLEAPDPELVAALSGPPFLRARLIPEGAPPEGPQVGFAGVGKPWKVERALRAAGCDLVDFAAFPDHAPWTPARLKALDDLARAHGAGLVTTTKDWVRLPPAWREKVRAWPVRAVFDSPAEVDALLERLPRPGA
jgi:tetraacyldisaccharide 4'-kinase